MPQLGRNPCKSRLILLGASNLSIGLAPLVRRAVTRLPGPLDIRLAAGFGRSYGRSSRVLGRTLPGILESDLFKDLDLLDNSERDRPTFALITDIGNDIGYQVDPPQIIEWVGACVEKIRSVQPATKLTMTGLPIGSLKRLSTFHFELAKRMLFPSCRLKHEDVLERMRFVDAAIRDMVHSFDIAVIEVENEWYGLDPIHVCRACRATYWNRVVESWLAESNSSRDESETPAASLPRRPWLEMYLQTRWPKRRRVLGTIHHRAQPSGRCRDGSTISVY